MDACSISDSLDVFCITSSITTDGGDTIAGDGIETAFNFVLSRAFDSTYSLIASKFCFKSDAILPSINPTGRKPFGRISTA